MAQLTLLLLQLNMYKKDWWWNYILVYSPLTEPKLLFPALLCSPKMRYLQMLVCDLLKELQNLVTTDVFSLETIFLWNRCWISFKVTLYVVWSQWISLYTKTNFLNFKQLIMLRLFNFELFPWASGTGPLWGNWKLKENKFMWIHRQSYF